MIQQCKTFLHFGIWSRQGHTCHLKNCSCYSSLSQFYSCVSSARTKISICQAVSHGWITQVEQQLFLDHIPWSAFHELRKSGGGLFLLHIKEYSAAPLRILHLCTWVSLVVNAASKCQMVLAPLGGESLLLSAPPEPWHLIINCSLQEQREANHCRFQCRNRWGLIPLSCWF